MATGQEKSVFIPIPKKGKAKECSNYRTIALMVKRLSTMPETWVRSLGREDSLEKEMATHSITLAWKIPWTEKPWGRKESDTTEQLSLLL